MDFVDRFGERTIRLREFTLSYFFLLLTTLKMAGLQILGRTRGRWGLTARSMVRMGVYATPLITLISGLIGAIMALNSAKLLKQFGQEYRVADLVGLSITREIGPLLTALLVAGRSGSSLTAEIGTMEVSEEVDALEVMGVRPVGYLVAPRLIAMAAVLPALTIVADVVGVAGGLGIAVFFMDVSSTVYMAEIRHILKPGDVLGGLLKAFFFGMVIVTVAAHQGFSTRGGAAGVGKYTTRSVVLSIIWIIIVDALFTTVQYLMD
jgi:phospholipid/cholesterol/gamma-HCH transport system permease protein